MIRPIHVLPDFDSGGAERALLELLRVQRERLQPVLAPFSASGALLAEFKELGLPICPLGIDRPADLPGRLVSLTRLPRAVARLARLCREPETLLHAHMWHADMLCRLVGRVTGRPVLATCQLAALSPFRARLDRHSQRWLHARLGVSEDVVHFVQSELGGNCQLVENARGPVHAYDPAAARARLGLEDGPVVGCLGRLDSQKDPQLFAATAGMLRRRLPGLQAVWIGAGPRAQEFASGLRAAGVRWAGHRADGARLLSAFDVQLFCSHCEGFPLVLLECWSAGVPVVAPPVPGLRSQIVDGVDGLLVPRRMASLADAVLRVLDEPGLSARLVEGGRRAVLLRSPQAIAAQTEAVYHNILGF